MNAATIEVDILTLLSSIFVDLESDPEVRELKRLRRSSDALEVEALRGDIGHVVFGRQFWDELPAREGLFEVVTRP